MNRHELPQGISLQRPAWWRPGEAIDRPLTHEELARIKTPCAAPAAAPVEDDQDEPSSSTSKRQTIYRGWKQHVPKHNEICPSELLQASTRVSPDTASHKHGAHADKETQTHTKKQKHKLFTPGDGPGPSFHQDGSTDSALRRHARHCGTRPATSVLVSLRDVFGVLLSLCSFTKPFL